MVKTIAVDETFQGQTFHMEREWLDFKPVQGIIYPSRMTYMGRGGKPATAELKKVEFNPVLSEDRFKVPAAAQTGLGRRIQALVKEKIITGPQPSVPDEVLKYICQQTRPGEFSSDRRFP